MDHDFEIITKSAKETTDVGQEIASSLLSGELPVRTLCLYGDLGSGKTTFTQGFARGLGLTHRLLSPTFIIVRRYKLPRHFTFLYHIDLYRLTENYDGKALGLPEIISDPDSLVIIEWAEKLGALLPKNRSDIFFTALNNGTHTVRMKKYHE